MSRLVGSERGLSAGRSGEVENSDDRRSSVGVSGSARARERGRGERELRGRARDAGCESLEQ